MIETREGIHEGLPVAFMGTAHWHPIQKALGCLDRMLDRAVTEGRVIYGSAAATDPYRGLYVDHDQAQALVAREPGVPLFHANTDGLLLEEIDGSLRWVQDTFGLDGFDMALVLVALATEVDLRYERIYAYLQDDVTRRRPSVELALNLLCSSPQEKLTRRAHMAPEAPLLKYELLHLVADPNALQPPLGAYYLKLDDQITRMILGQPGLDPRLMPYCELVEPVSVLDDLTLEETSRCALQTLVDEVKATRRPLRLLFTGPRGVGKRKAAEWVASKLGVPLLVVDLRGLLAAADAGRLLTLLGREARWHNAVLYLKDSGLPGRDDHPTSVQQVLKRVGQHSLVIVATDKPTPSRLGEEPLDLITVTFPAPGFELRRHSWLTHLNLAGIPPNDLDELAGRFRLTPGQIASAVSLARNAAHWRQAARTDGQTAPPETAPTRRDLFVAASAQSGDDLAALARRIDPMYNWADIVLPADQHAQLREICSQVRHQHVVYDTWGFGRKLSRGQGVNVLFSGPPGTGKTMAAEVIANDLQLELYKIDLSQVVSKYIGETEKNLDRIFTAAESANAILFFDEADALFGKRSEVRDSHDRYANLEISYLLQKMEEYEGVAILATNLRQHMDEAFVRRLQVIVELPFPDEGQRRRIWEVLLPANAPLADDVVLDTLAREIKLAGGNLRSIALAAAFYAAADKRRISMAHFLQAARREYQKLGRVWPENEGHLRAD